MQFQHLSENVMPRLPSSAGPDVTRGLSLSNTNLVSSIPAAGLDRGLSRPSLVSNAPGGGVGPRPATIGAPLSAAKSVNDLDQLIQFGGGGGGLGGNSSVSSGGQLVPPPLASAAPAMHYYQQHQQNHSRFGHY